MVWELKLEPRDRVLVRLVGLKGKHKLSDKLEYEPYVVLSQPSLGILVYKIRKETSKGRIRTLHRNKLLPFFGLPVPLQKVKQQKKQSWLKSQKFWIQILTWTVLHQIRRVNLPQVQISMSYHSVVKGLTYQVSCKSANLFNLFRRRRFLKGFYHIGMAVILVM